MMGDTIQTKHHEHEILQERLHASRLRDESQSEHSREELAAAKAKVDALEAALQESRNDLATLNEKYVSIYCISRCFQFSPADSVNCIVDTR